MHTKNITTTKTSCDVLKLEFIFLLSHLKIAYTIHTYGGNYVKSIRFQVEAKKSVVGNEHSTQKNKKNGSTVTDFLLSLLILRERERGRESQIAKHPNDEGDTTKFTSSTLHTKACFRSQPYSENFAPSIFEAAAISRNHTKSPLIGWTILAGNGG